MFSKKTVRDIDVKDKRVLVRVDFNVPLTDGIVTDDTRIRAVLPTINYLLEHNARVILLSHFGRPAGTGFEEEYSLAPIVRVLERLLGRPVLLVNDLCGDTAKAAVEALADGEVMMLENTRFDKREKKNDEELSRCLASFGDIFVNEAFSAAHRAHASTVGIAHHIPAVAGFLLEREVSTLSSMIEDPKRPFVAILGGSKVSDKIGVINRLLEIVDTLIIGGGMCFTFLAAKGLETGSSLMEEDWVESAAEMLKCAEEKGVEFLLPRDIVVSSALAQDSETKIVDADAIPTDMMGLDIGPDTCEVYKQAIAKAHTIFWNGPMGVFEIPAFENGTKQVARAVAKNKEASSIIGGGDSVAALNKYGLADKITFISTGGGASMEHIESKVLPGVDALLDA